VSQSFDPIATTVSSWHQGLAAVKHGHSLTKSNTQNKIDKGNK
jgi:hypothetical protein